jgi:hypothetical protein
LLLKMLTEEFEGCDGDHTAKVYHVAAHFSLSHGDKARASIFA